MLAILGPRPNASTIPIEEHGNGNHRNTDEPEGTRRPGNAQIVIHERSKEGEPGAKEATHEGVGTDRTVGDGRVHVDQVVQTLHEDHVHACPDRGTADNHASPVDIGVGCPGKDEESNRQQTSSGDHEGQSLLGDHCLVPVVVAPRLDDHNGTADQNSDHHADIRKGADSQGPATDFAEGDGVRNEHEV